MSQLIIIIIRADLNVTPDYVCPRCFDQACPIDGRPITHVEVDGTLLDVEASFCYLSDMLCAGGGCALAVDTRCSTAWGKFRKLLPILTSKHVSPLTRGKVFGAYVRSALLHRSETWAPTAPDLQRLHRNDRAMIRWICGVPHGNPVHKVMDSGGSWSEDDLHMLLNVFSLPAIIVMYHTFVI